MKNNMIIFFVVLFIGIFLGVMGRRSVEKKTGPIEESLANPKDSIDSIVIYKPRSIITIWGPNRSDTVKNCRACHDAHSIE